MNTRGGNIMLMYGLPTVKRKRKLYEKATIYVQKLYTKSCMHTTEVSNMHSLYANLIRVPILAPPPMAFAIYLHDATYAYHGVYGSVWNTATG